MHKYLFCLDNAKEYVRENEIELEENELLGIARGVLAIEKNVEYCEIFKINNEERKYIARHDRGTSPRTKANQRYYRKLKNEKRIRYVKVEFRDDDLKLFDHLEKQKSKQSYILKLIREDMASGR